MNKHVVTYVSMRKKNVTDTLFCSNFSQRPDKWCCWYFKITLLKPCFFEKWLSWNAIQNIIFWNLVRLICTLLLRMGVQLINTIKHINKCIRNYRTAIDPIHWIHVILQCHNVCLEQSSHLHLFILRLHDIYTGFFFIPDIQNLFL